MATVILPVSFLAAFGDCEIRNRVELRFAAIRQEVP
jgi:hypothetical protein